MRPKFQSKQEVIIQAPLEKVWEFNMDLSKIVEYHPRVNKVDFISGKQFRETGVSYQCHLKDGKNTCIEKDIEIVPMQKLVTVFPQDTMGLTKLLPDYIVESNLSKIGDNATKVEMAHFYSSSKLTVWLLNFIIKRKIARETQDTLNAMKKSIESNYYYLNKTWLSPKQDVRPSPIQGMGIFALEAIKQGEVVEIIGGQVMSEGEFEIIQRNTPRYNAVQIGEGLHLVELVPNTYERKGSLNHSCDSNLWMTDAVTLVARFDIAAGQELTVDYALFTAQSHWVLEGVCQCGTRVCRKTVTGDDWKLRDVQKRYQNHFSPFLNERINQIRSRYH